MLTSTIKTEQRAQSFVFGVAVGGDNFIAREEERRHLRQNFEEGLNSIIISPRRWGKTSLVKRVCEEVDEERVSTVFLDIFGSAASDHLPQNTTKRPCKNSHHSNSGNGGVSSPTR